jgi:hypothetical protein
MDILKTVRTWAASLAETVISLLALGIVFHSLANQGLLKL